MPLAFADNTMIPLAILHKTFHGFGKQAHVKQTDQSNLNITLMKMNGALHIQRF